jgi:enoyl-CoA hydratase
METKFETIELTIDGPVAELTMSRPKALNALNTKCIEELHAALNLLEKNEKIRALIITGSGEKSFVAGADIKEIANLSPQEANLFSEKGQKVFRQLEIMRFPVIAAVNGFALGGGLELALSCDFIVASENAKLGLPEVGLGIMPGFGGTQRLPRAIGVGQARKMIYSGLPVDAKRAFEIGLVTDVVPLSELMDTARTLAKRISMQGPVAVCRSKEAIDKGLDTSLDEGLIIEREIFGDLFRTTDAREGTKAFVENRKAEFKGQ